MKETKPEIIGVLFAKLKPNKKDVFADIGCGSGAVSEFFSRYVSKVYAVERDESMLQIAKERLKGNNIELILSDGYDFLKEHDCDIAFFGGTKGIERMLEVCDAERIAVNAARIEVAVEVTKKMKSMGIFDEVLILNISRSYELAGGTAFRTLNPVFMILGKR
ncbi:Precorrin-6B methylase 2 [Archaeoglobus sulfaticallidus PM70-1]|uniref:Precorrin-6B methylase 2 n=1 Tax=Archaeoglobus sulfaticallidus PM70-1 TaxID=387631 RepID=N0BGR3_9EURY|nr:methyltransferase domain-containing protein [Archaeoglobus sulfaticallidus]AGK62198.1 Precorrin-6B methylase 2 [Archaeoglobus sulfaticallidus PM70-1]